jgi:Tfp pilus assembly protein PilF
MGQFDQAIVCWHRIEGSKKGGDAEAQEMISRLTLERNRERAGIPRERGAGPVVKPSTRRLAGITRTAPAAKAAGETAEGEDGQTPTPARREIPLTERQKLEQATREFPARVDNYMKLAELHVAEHRYADAEKTLAKAMEVSGGVLKTREMLEDVQLLRMKEQSALADQRAAEDGTAASSELASQMRAELNRRELELLSARSERYPQDGELKYELGLRLKRAGNYAEAIKVFQAARETPERKAAATLEMGECLQQLRQFAKAQTCYDRAVDLAEAGTSRPAWTNWPPWGILLDSKLPKDSGN